MLSAAAAAADDDAARLAHDAERMPSGEPYPPDTPSWHLRRPASVELPLKLLPIMSDVLVTSHAQTVPALSVGTELLEALLTRAARQAIEAMQPRERLSHLRPMQRLLERTTGNYPESTSCKCSVTTRVPACCLTCTHVESPPTVLRQLQPKAAPASYSYRAVRCGGSPRVARPVADSCAMADGG